MKGNETSKRSKSGNRQTAARGNANHPALPPPPRGAKRRDTGQPGGGQGRVDLVGIVPKGIRVDPDLTEGHPGYQESGDSEISLPQRTRKRRSSVK
jgi:hypothetical protein